MRMTAVLAVLLLVGGCGVSQWWADQTPEEKLQYVEMAYNSAMTVYNGLSPEKQESVAKYKVAVDGALESLRATVGNGGDIDVAAILKMINEAHAAFNEAQAAPAPDE